MQVNEFLSFNKLKVKTQPHLLHKQNPIKKSKKLVISHLKVGKRVAKQIAEIIQIRQKIRGKSKNKSNWFDVSRSKVIVTLMFSKLKNKWCR